MVWEVSQQEKFLLAVYRAEAGDQQGRLRSYKREWARANYARNTAKLRQKAREWQRAHRPQQRKYRRKNAIRINEHRRELRRQKREHRRASQIQKALVALGRSPQTLAEWFSTETRFATWKDLARELGVSRSTVRHWAAERAMPTGQRRQRLFGITGLLCFGGQETRRPLPHAASPKQREYKHNWYLKNLRRLR